MCVDGGARGALWFVRGGWRGGEMLAEFSRFDENWACAFKKWCLLLYIIYMYKEQQRTPYIHLVAVKPKIATSDIKRGDMRDIYFER